MILAIYRSCPRVPVPKPEKDVLIEKAQVEQLRLIAEGGVSMRIVVREERHAQPPAEAATELRVREAEQPLVWKD